MKNNTILVLGEPDVSQTAMRKRLRMPTSASIGWCLRHCFAKYFSCARSCAGCTDGRRGSTRICFRS